MSQQPECLSSPNVVVVWVLRWSEYCGGPCGVVVWLPQPVDVCGGPCGPVALWSECVSGLNVSVVWGCRQCLLYYAFGKLAVMAEWWNWQTLRI